MKRRVTIGTIAERCGVSRMAVSFALRGSTQVSEQLRAKVTRVARELGYVPSRAARLLHGQGPRQIAAVLPMPTSPAHARVAEAFEIACREAEAEASVHFHYWHGETERKVLERLLDQGLSGLLLFPSGTATTESLVELQSRGLSAPIVTWSGRPDYPGLSNHRGNYALPAKDVGEACIHRLKALGHTKVAFLFQGPMLRGGTATELAASFRAAAGRQMEVELFYLDDSSSPIRQKVLKGQPCTWDDMWATNGLLARYFFDHEFSATAVITSDDLCALHLLREGQKRGLDFPDNLALLSLTGSQAGQMGSLTLGHVATPLADIMRHAVQNLLAPPGKEQTPIYPFSIEDGETLAPRPASRRTRSVRPLRSETNA